MPGNYLGRDHHFSSRGYYFGSEPVSELPLYFKCLIGVAAVVAYIYFVGAVAVYAHNKAARK